ncbi:MAG: sulfotransferase family protein [Nocardioides sp.]
MTEPEHPTSAPTKLVVVTGSGRSGTSTVAGALKRLGLHIPQPEIEPDESNPRGFYEPAWVVAFHKRLLNSIPARTNDARPKAAALVKAAGEEPGVREELVAWLAEHVAVVGPGGQLAIKDPRAFWFHDLWKAAASDLGLEISFLTMLRHPTEVAQSRDTHYLQQQSEDFRRTRQTANIAGWVNAAFETEIATRGYPRAFVRYTDLMADWRGAMATARDQLGITYNTDLAPGEHHDVDDFIDVKLHRAKVTWGDIDTLPALQQLAETSWDALNALVEDPEDTTAVAGLTGAHPTYVALHDYAEAIALDHTNCEVAKERRRVHEKLGERHAQEVRQLRRKLRRKRRQLRAAGAGTGAGRGAGRPTGILAKIRRRTIG